MTGLPYPIRLAGYGLRAPNNPVIGMDLAGVVEVVGKDVTRFQPGDEVFGLGKGSFAEYARAPENKLAPKPANLSFEQAAVVAVSGLTALQGVRDHGKVAPGQKVLIIGASGGVGSYAVQLAKAFGAEVTAVCSTTKVDLVRSLGADHVVDYTREDFAKGEQRYDVILDIGGNSSLSRLRGVLTPKGRLIIMGGETSGRWLGGSDRQIRALALSPFVRSDVEDIRQQGKPRGHARPHRAHRSRKGHTGHRPDLPACRGAEGNPLPGRRARPRKGRHHHLKHVSAMDAPRPAREAAGHWLRV